MIYFLFVLIAALSTAAIVCFAARMGAVDLGAKLNIYKKANDEIVPFAGNKMVLVTTICFVVATILQISLYNNTGTINVIKLFALYVIVAAAAIVDYKRRIIPNALLVFGLLFRLGVYAYELFRVPDVKSVLVNDLIGFAAGFGILALASLITKGAVGFGDVKLFGLIGIMSGAFCTYSTLLVSLILSTVVSLTGIARKKMGRKDSIPFGPCIAVGYAIVLLLASY